MSQNLLPEPPVRAIREARGCLWIHLPEGWYDAWSVHNPYPRQPRQWPWLVETFGDDLIPLVPAKTKVEHAQLMSGGGMHVRWDDPEVERIFPLDQWIKANSRGGGRVFRRTIVVVEDWTEVTDP